MATMMQPLSAINTKQIEYMGKSNYTPNDYREMKPLFLSLQSEDMAFQKAIQVNCYKAGHKILLIDEMVDSMYLLVQGRIRLICKNAETGIQFVMTTLEPGAMFGQGTMDAPGRQIKYIEAVDDVTLWVLAADVATNLLMRHPVLSWGLLQTYAARLAQVEDRLEAVAHKKLPARLAALLLQLANERNQLLGISHQALADNLGTYRETVSNILRNFKRERLLTLGYRHITLLNLPALREIAANW
ncbi:MAG: Crp/Fnr family transcriptional regulator [Caldilineaceae bacterium]